MGTEGSSAGADPIMSCWNMAEFRIGGNKHERVREAQLPVIEVGLSGVPN